MIGGKAWLRGIDLAGLAGTNSDVFFDGEIDDVALFSRALSPDEVLDMFTAGHALATADSP